MGWPSTVGVVLENVGSVLARMLARLGLGGVEFPQPLEVAQANQCTRRPAVSRDDEPGVGVLGLAHHSGELVTRSISPDFLFLAICSGVGHCEPQERLRRLREPNNIQPI